MSSSTPASLFLYWLLLLAIGGMRLAELSISRRRQARMLAAGIARASEPHFGAMVALHTGILIAAAVEAHLRSGPPHPALVGGALVLVAAAIALRLWVIDTLGPHWNVQIMDSAPLGIVASGPFRWIRHPNYVAVFLELFALPLVYGGYITAVAGSLLHLWVLRHRIVAEEQVLLAHPEYQAVMGDKPRFFPRIAGLERNASNPSARAGSDS